MAPTIETVAIIGTGVVGRSWARVFSRAGCRTRLYDGDPAQVERALVWLQECAVAEAADGDSESVAAAMALVSGHTDLAEAVAGAGYVQESSPERLPLKQTLFAALERAAAPETILASSTSALDMTAIASGLGTAARCVVAHPVNPPHVIPAVEIVPGQLTDPAVVERTAALMRSVGQTPVVMNFYLNGFLLNRMQAALWQEAIHLVESGAADVEAVDAVIRDGLGLRWALMGPFGVGDTNADGGVREYFERYGPTLRGIMDELGHVPALDAAQIERLGQSTDAMNGVGSRPARLAWRDRLIRRIIRLKSEERL
jgi:3-hydroxyacyl-CoA dehydrogenase